MGYILSFIVGSGLTYFVSDVVQENVHKIREDVEAISASEEAIKQEFIKLAIKFEREGRLSEFIDTLRQESQKMQHYNTINATAF